MEEIGIRKYSLCFDSFVRSNNQNYHCSPWPFTLTKEEDYCLLGVVVEFLFFNSVDFEILVLKIGA